MNNTKKNIIEAALEIFVEHGFAGASISKIAKKASINQSLIYHYFKSKEDLWQKVKKQCIDDAIQDQTAIRHDCLEHFVDDLVRVRLAVYEKSSMQMIVHWQALESNKPLLGRIESESHSLFDITNHVKTLQKQGLIRSDYNNKVISALIFNLTSYAYFDYSQAFKLSNQHYSQYKQFITAMLINELKPSSQIINP